MTFCLGKLPATRDPRTLQYEDYRASVVPTPPAQAHWGRNLPYAMLMNDQLGDCGEAAMGHMVQTWGDDAGNTFSPTDAETVSAYSAVSGYVPGNPSTDRGTNLMSALAWWRSTGFAGHQITAYMEVNPGSQEYVMESVYAYGGLYTGIQLPTDAQAQTGKVWTVTTGPGAAPGSWGGHCVPIVGYDQDTLWCVTWGTEQAMTWDWFETYCDEAYVCLSANWMKQDQRSPSGLQWGQLTGDLANL